MFYCYPEQELTAVFVQVREVIKQAKNELSMLKRSTILFMDEVHRKAEITKLTINSYCGNQCCGSVSF